METSSKRVLEQEKAMSFMSTIQVNSIFLFHFKVVENLEDSRTVFQSDGKNPHIVPLQETTQQYRKMRGQNPGLGNL